MKGLRNWGIALLVGFLLVLCAGCGHDYRHISHEKAMELMRPESGAVVVDVRSKEEYDKRHIVGALLVPIDDIRSGKVDALPTDKNRKLLLYCWTGRRSEDAAVMLTEMGYNQVYEFGGLVDWNGPVEGEEVDRH